MTDYNGDGTYDVTLDIDFINNHETTRRGGVSVTLSGYHSADGTSPTVAPGGKGKCTVHFHNVSGGTYKILF